MEESVTSTLDALSYEELVEYFWSVGDLRYKLWSQQVPIHRSVNQTRHSSQYIVNLCARQFGKTRTEAICFAERSIWYDNRSFVVLGPTYDQTRELFVPHMTAVCADAPEGYVRRLKSEKKWFVGSCEILIAGVDKGGSSKRGKTLQDVAIEEVVDWSPDRFDETIRSDVGPAMLHSDGGRIIFNTTLPKEPDHPFLTDIMPVAEAHGALNTFTIDDNVAITPEQRADAIEKAGGWDSDECKREYRCIQVRDPQKMVVPYYDAAKLFVDHYEIPQHVNLGVFADWGGTRDFTVALLAFHDYFAKLDVILDELWFMPNTPSNLIVAGLKSWRDNLGVYGGIKQWIVDAPGQLLIDMNQPEKPDARPAEDIGGIAAMLPQKSDWRAAVNALGVSIQRNEQRIHSRCKLLAASVRSGTFNDQKTDFARTKALGHMDALAADMYLVRHLDRSNPFPATTYSQTLYQPRASVQPPTVKQIRKFGRHAG